MRTQCIVCVGLRDDELVTVGLCFGGVFCVCVYLCVLLNLCVDVARPDKISGADINSICQEVSV